MRVRRRRARRGAALVAAAAVGLAGVQAAASAGTAAAEAAAPGAASTASAAASAASSAPSVVPALTSWTAAAGTFTLGTRSRIVVDRRYAADLRPDAQTFAGDLAAEGVPQLPVVVAAGPRAGDVFLTEASGAGAATAAQGASYALTVNGAGATISGVGAAGVFYGEQSVEQILKTADGHDVLPDGQASDAPAEGERGLMLDTAREYWPVATIEQTIRQMAWVKLDTLHWHLTDSEAFRLQLPGYPGLAAAQSYSQRDVRAVLAYAQKYHVQVVPEMDVPGHSTALTAYDPALRWDCASMNDTISPGRIDPGFTVDIGKPANVAWMDGLVSAFLKEFAGVPVVDLGGDETPDQALMSECPEVVDDAAAQGYGNTEDVFLAYENHLDSLVRAHGQTMQIWGWWPQVGGGSSVTVNKDVIIQAWLADEAGFLADGYHVVVSNEHSLLYVVPKFTPGSGNGNYIPNDATLYGSYAPVSSPQVVGVEMAQWGDDAFEQPASYFTQYLRRPMQILASATWDGPRSDSYLDYEALADAIGSAPGVPETAAPNATVITGTAYSGSGYTGIDVGAGNADRVTAVRILPSGNSTTALSSLVGGVLQGCTTGPTTGCETLAQVRSTPTTDWWTLPSSDGTTAFRWLRYLAPSGGTAVPAQLQFLEPPASAAQVDVQPGASPSSDTVVVRNTSAHAISPVSLRVVEDGTASQGELSGKVNPSRLPKTIAAGASVTVPVSFSAAAAAGQYQVTATLTFGQGVDSADRYTAEGTNSTTVGYRDLAEAFDNIAVTDDEDPELGDVDGQLSSFSLQDLAAAGASPGAAVTADGFRFTWPDVPASSLDNVLATGQTIALHARAAQIGLLVTGTYAPAAGITATGNVTYTDGTTSAYTITVPDWTHGAIASGPGADDVVAIAGTRTNADGKAATVRTADVYAVSIPADASRQIASITLPDLPGYIAAKAPGLHVFAVSAR